MFYTKVKSDLYRLTGKISFNQILKYIFMNNIYRQIFLFRYLNTTYLTGKKSNFLIRYLYRNLSIKNGIDLPYETKVGCGFNIHHGYGIVINRNSILGENIDICQGVTIGKNKKNGVAGYPILMNNIYIAPGAKILGDITVGNNVIIGANAVVIESVPDNSVVGGIPAKILKINIYDDFLVNKWVKK